MKILPAIDLLDGNCVQLVGGNPNQILYSCDPFEKAEEFAKLGALWIIDLNATLGTGSNSEIVKKLLKKYPAYVGGGIRTVEKANEIFSRSKITFIAPPIINNLIQMFPFLQIFIKGITING